MPAGNNGGVWYNSHSRGILPRATACVYSHGSSCNHGQQRPFFWSRANDPWVQAWWKFNAHIDDLRSSRNIRLHLHFAEGPETEQTWSPREGIIWSTTPKINRFLGIKEAALPPITKDKECYQFIEFAYTTINLLIIAILMPSKLYKSDAFILRYERWKNRSPRIRRRILQTSIPFLISGTDTRVIGSRLHIRTKHALNQTKIFPSFRRVASWIASGYHVTLLILRLARKLSETPIPAHVQRCEAIMHHHVKVVENGSDSFGHSGCERILLMRVNATVIKFICRAPIWQLRLIRVWGLFFDADQKTVLDQLCRNQIPLLQ